jgi:hypothetical protein
MDGSNGGNELSAEGMVDIGADGPGADFVAMGAFERGTVGCVAGNRDDGSIRWMSRRLAAADAGLPMASCWSTLALLALSSSSSALVFTLPMLCSSELVVGGDFLGQGLSVSLVASSSGFGVVLFLRARGGCSPPQGLCRALCIFSDVLLRACVVVVFLRACSGYRPPQPGCVVLRRFVVGDCCLVDRLQSCCWTSWANWPLCGLFGHRKQWQKWPQWHRQQHVSVTTTTVTVAS